jgi:two-component system OmpR family sensor kinase
MRHGGTTVRGWAAAPLRLRVTIAFTGSMAVVLAALAGFLHVRLAAELLRGTDLELRYRAGVIVAALARPGPVPVDAGRAVIDPDEAFAQVLDAGGRVRDASTSVRGAALLSTPQLRDLRFPTFLTRRVPGVDDPARLLAVPVAVRGRAAVVVVGANLGDRQEALDRLRLLLLLGMPAALALASVAGWLVAGAALRPVERLRNEAAAISLGAREQRLTVPPTGDELARLAGTLNELLGRQQQALAREQRFVDDASHELRTPLAVLQAELDLALARPRGRDELAAAVRVAAVQTHRLVRLAEVLLVLARSRPGGLPLQRSAVPLRRLLQESAAGYRARAEAAGSPITVRAPDQQVRADPVRLRQAVDNLLDNALRYGAGSPVVLTAEVGDGEVAITVADGGPGWPASVRERVFEPFVRGAQEPVPGAGLGLAVVRAVAEAHGGRVRAGTGPAGGASVDLVLPT